MYSRHGPRSSSVAGGGSAARKHSAPKSVQAQQQRKSSAPAPTEFYAMSNRPDDDHIRRSYDDGEDLLFRSPMKAYLRTSAGGGMSPERSSPPRASFRPHSSGLRSSSSAAAVSASGRRTGSRRTGAAVDSDAMAHLRLLEELEYEQSMDLPSPVFAQDSVSRGNGSPYEEHPPLGAQDPSYSSASNRRAVSASRSRTQTASPGTVFSPRSPSRQATTAPYAVDIAGAHSQNSLHTLSAAAGTHGPALDFSSLAGSQPASRRPVTSSSSARMSRTSSGSHRKTGSKSARSGASGLSEPRPFGAAPSAGVSSSSSSAAAAAAGTSASTFSSSSSSRLDRPTPVEIAAAERRILASRVEMKQRQAKMREEARFEQRLTLEALQAQIEEANGLLRASSANATASGGKPAARRAFQIFKPSSAGGLSADVRVHMYEDDRLVKDISLDLFEREYKVLKSQAANAAAAASVSSQSAGMQAGPDRMASNSLFRGGPHVMKKETKERLRYILMDTIQLTAKLRDQVNEIERKRQISY